jgi:hypothetical protein
MAALFSGIFLMTLAAGRLSESDGSYVAYLGGAAACSLLVQAIAGWRHNHRVPSDADLQARPDGNPGSRAS